jgi:hypothetical protein
MKLQNKGSFDGKQSCLVRSISIFTGKAVLIWEVATVPVVTKQHNRKEAFKCILAAIFA